jgi:hypothetical protein
MGVVFVPMSINEDSYAELLLGKKPKKTKIQDGTKLRV